MEITELKNMAKKISVLYVEDEIDIRERLTSFLTKIFSNVDVAYDGADGWEKYSKKDYDIVITDISMPRMNGLEMIRLIREKNLKQEVIVISAYADANYLSKSIELGVTGYIIKPVEMDQMLYTLELSIEKISAFRENEIYRTNLEQLVEEKTHKQFELEAEKLANYEETLTSLVSLIEERDTYTGGHSARVANYCVKIAIEMGYSIEDQQKLSKASILHDIGKISTPDSILLNPKKLTGIEYKLIKEHVTTGYEVLSNISMYAELSEIIYCHHERYDGKGYPRGLQGEDIPSLARIMIVADSFDAMTTNRIYKSRMTVEESINELKRGAGSQFHPEVVEAMLGVLSKEKIQIEDISQAPISKLQEEKFAYFYKDNLTKLYNKSYLEYILSKNESKYNFLALICLKNFGSFNKQKGWGQGDALLEKFASDLVTMFPDQMIFRIFGDDFIVLSKEHITVDTQKLQSADYFKDSEITVVVEVKPLEKNIDINMLDSMTH